jgi:peroxiredoxin
MDASAFPPARAAGPGSGWLLPGLELRQADGTTPAPLWAYRGRGPLLVFLHEGPQCAACAAHLAALATAYAGYREQGCQVLAVGPAPVAGLPYPVLVDPGARLAAALGLRPPALLVVGRTGEIWAAWGGAHATLPPAAEVASWLEYALGECRECFCCEPVWPEAEGRDTPAGAPDA